MKSNKKHKASVLLRAWLIETGRKQKWLALHAGSTRAAVSKWVIGATAPDIQTRRRISQITSGAVPVTSWEVTE